MDYFQIGDTIDYSKYNGLVYLLRKFKRLRTSIKLGEKNIANEYATFRFIGDFTNINGNYILEENVNIHADDVFKNAIYTFVFNAINIDTSEEINRRIIYKEDDTGEDGILNITLPDNMLNENEVLLPDVTVDIIFDTHEYQNSLNSFKASLDVEEQYLESGTNTITLTLLEPDDTPVEGILTTIYINGTPHQVETDENGEAEYTYQYTGKAGKVIVRSNGATAVFFDGGINFVYEPSNTHIWNLELGYHSQQNNSESWLPSNGVITLSCTETSNEWSLNNPKTKGTFTSQSIGGVTEAHYSIKGDVTAIGTDMFNSCYGLTEIFIPRGIESIGARAFYYTTGLESIEIPDTVYVLGYSCFSGSRIEKIKLPSTINSIGASCFNRCKIQEYELSWAGNEIIPYNKNKFPVIEETVFRIPPGESANYIAKNYPEERLVEGVAYSLTLESATPIISRGETASAIATLTADEEPAVGEEIEYAIKQGSTTISTGTATTNSSGQATISYTGTGIGDVQIIVTYDDLEETVTVEDCWIYLTTLPAMSQSTIATGYYKDTFNTPLDLPSKYDMEVDFNMADSSPFITVIVGEDTSNYYYHGFGNQYKQLTMAISRNNNRSVLIDDSSYRNQVTDHFTVSYDGTSQSIKGISRTISTNNSEYSPAKFLGLLWGRTSTINYIKVKAL